MFDIGTLELVVIALLALIVIGPKDLPGLMRTVGIWVRRAQNLTRDFRTSMEDMARESELDDAHKAFKSATRFDSEIEDALDPTGLVSDELAQPANEKISADPPPPKPEKPDPPKAETPAVRSAGEGAS